MFSWYYNKTVQFLETCPWREGIKGRSGEGMHNDCPLLHPHNTELFDIKLDLTTLPSPADNSAKLLLIRFQRLLRIVQLFSRKCKTLQSNLTRFHWGKEGQTVRLMWNTWNPELQCQQVQTWGGCLRPTCTPKPEMKTSQCAPSIREEWGSFWYVETSVTCRLSQLQFLFIAALIKQLPQQQPLSH